MVKCPMLLIVAAVAMVAAVLVDFRFSITIYVVTMADSSTKPNKTIAMLYTSGKAQSKYQVIGIMYS
jgi:hypothetical protein